MQQQQQQLLEQQRSISVKAEEGGVGVAGEEDASGGGLAEEVRVASQADGQDGKSQGVHSSSDGIGEANHSLAGQLLAAIFGRDEASEGQGHLSTTGDEALMGASVGMDFGGLKMTTQEDVALTPPGSVGVDEQDEIMASILEMGVMDGGSSSSDTTTTADTSATTSWDYQALGLDLGMDLSVDVDVPNGLLTEQVDDGYEADLKILNDHVFSSFIKSEPVS